ncbi:Tic22 family protein [Geitlerinema sp. P-1104]|uniref:Tic22 family protein n=1 Tax=Geitlerinema sp. P-1104 TaxID=2546230 RepID=UPI0014778266|nr:Tic22 family protein [Geitlerinema sp. P-1104]
MKSLIRWGATLGLVGGTLFGSVSAPAPALALSEDEIMQKLASVPVFAITDAEGSPLIASISNPERDGEMTEVAGVFVFMNPQDANRVVERLTQEQPEMAGEVQVTVISLAEIYQLEQRNRDQNTPIEFSYVPTRQDIESAVSVLLDSGREGELVQQNGEYIYPGVPLFMATAGPEQGYMTVEVNGEPVIPLFFGRDDLDNVIAHVEEQQPDFASTVETDVVRLEGVLETLRNEDNEMVGQLMFVPHSESLEFVGNLMQQMQQQRQQQQPQLQPGNSAPPLPDSGR